MRPAREFSQEPRNAHELFIPQSAGNSRGESADWQRQRAALRHRNHILKERVRELEEQNRSLEDFSAMAAHELLKPLILSEATAKGILDRTSSRLDLVSQDDLQRMVRASARVRMLVEGLLAVTRDDGATLKRERVDMALVVQHCLELLDPEIRSKGARIVVDPMPVVLGNSALLNGAMGNLVANAIKYGPRSNAEIRVGAQRGGPGWVFEVDSPGRPIPERDLGHIFEAWQRGNNERRARGAGLGLAIVRRIVERHGGEVGVTPLGKGNRFYFTVPA
jgi:signal transduction histidine kinase